MTDLIETIAVIIDPHAFDLGSRAHPEWADDRKAKALDKAETIIELVLRPKPIAIIHED